jgi:hypothetical protein
VEVSYVPKTLRKRLVSCFSKLSFICPLMVTCMICSPSKKLLIFLLIATVQLTMGCRAKYDVRLIDIKEGTEDIFCAAHPNHAQAQSFSGAMVFVSIWHDPDLKKNVARIEAQAADDLPILVVGKQLQEGDTFSVSKGVKRVKWEILKIGTEGLTVDGDKWCGDGKFIHVNRLEPKQNN